MVTLFVNLEYRNVQVILGRDDYAPWPVATLNSLIANSCPPNNVAKLTDASYILEGEVAAIVMPGSFLVRWCKT